MPLCGLVNLSSVSLTVVMGTTHSLEGRVDCHSEIWGMCFSIYIYILYLYEKVVYFVIFLLLGSIPLALSSLLHKGASELREYNNLLSLSSYLSLGWLFFSALINPSATNRQSLRLYGSPSCAFYVVLTHETRDYNGILICKLSFHRPARYRNNNQGYSTLGSWHRRSLGRREAEREQEAWSAVPPVRSDMRDCDIGTHSKQPYCCVHTVSRCALDTSLLLFYVTDSCPCLEHLTPLYSQRECGPEERRRTSRANSCDAMYR